MRLASLIKFASMRLKAYGSLCWFIALIETSESFTTSLASDEVVMSDEIATTNTEADSATCSTVHQSIDMLAVSITDQVAFETLSLMSFALQLRCRPVETSKIILKCFDGDFEVNWRHCTRELHCKSMKSTCWHLEGSNWTFNSSSRSLKISLGLRLSWIVISIGCNGPRGVDISTRLLSVCGNHKSLVSGS